MPRSLLGEEEIKVIAVDSSGAVRQLLSDVLRSAGFNNVQGVASVKDVISILEIEQVDLILTPLMAEEDVNAMQLLKLISEQPSLQQVRVILLAEEAEYELLPDAFQFGLLTYFEKPFNKVSISAAIKDFLELYESYAENDVLFAAAAANDILAKTSRYQSQIELLRGTMKLFPGDARFLFKLIEPLFHIGKLKESKATIAQTKLIDPSLTEEIDQLEKELFTDSMENNEGEEEGSEEESETMNIIGLHKVLIVDSDAASIESISSTIEELGVPEIIEYQDGEEAAAWVAEQEEGPDMVFCEWALPSLTGPYMIQRILEKFPGTPVIIVSSLLKKEDKPFLEEMGILAIVKKPVEKESFLKETFHIVQQERNPTNSHAVERKIRAALKQGKMDEARTFQVKLDEDGDVSKIRKLGITGEFAYAEEEYTKARDHAAAGLRINSDAIHLLNLLGKSLLKLDDYVSSLKCFEKAQSLSPKNVERLCQIAEVNIEIENQEQAQEAIDEAKEQDEGNEGVQKTEAKVALTSGDSDTAKEIMQNLSSINEIISFMNNKAVAQARVGKYEEGISLYQETIKAIPEKETNTKGRVIYNVALAHVRQGDLEDAVVALNQAISIPDTIVKDKALSLKKRLENAIAKGLEVKLNQAPGKEQKQPAQEIGAPEAESTSDSQEDAKKKGIISTLVTNPGDLCLYLVFTDTDDINARFADLTLNTPRFKPREAIERGESMSFGKSKMSG